MSVSRTISQILSVKEWRDLETGGRDPSRSLKMAPFNRSYTTTIVVLVVPGYITLTGRLLLSLLRMQMTHYLVQSPILPIISSMSFYPNILTIHITLDQGRTHSFKLSVQHDDRNFIDRILLTECFSERPPRYVYEC